MARERVGAAAPWRWLQQAAALLRAHPRALLGGASLLVAMALLPSVATQLLAAVLPAAVAQAVGLLLSLLAYPPAVGGYFRLLHARALGMDWPGAAVFAFFADTRAALALVIAYVLTVCATILVVFGLAQLLGGEALLVFLQQTAKLQPGATTLPPLPPGALSFALSLLLVGVAIVAVQGFTFALLALTNRSPLAAIATAAGAVWRNFGTLLLWFLPLMLLAFLGLMLVGLAASLLGMLLALLSAALAKLVMLLIFLLAAIGLYALLFGFFYFGWRELFDTPPAPPEAPHRIAV